jgi:hypothetical protein
MSSFSFCSSWARDRESRFNWDFIYFIELDFVLFCTFLRSFSLSEIQRWIVFFVIFSTFFFAFRSTIFHLSTVVSIIAKSLSHTISSHYEPGCRLFTIWVQCLSAMPKYNAWVQCLSAMPECNAWVQCLSAMSKCNAWVSAMS